MKIQIASDIHTETYTKDDELPTLIPSCDVLALCGDIGNVDSDVAIFNYKRYLKWASENYKLVILLAGNNEYHSEKMQYSMITIKEKIIEIVAEFDNIQFMDRDVLEYEDATIVLGCTLWTRPDFSKSDEMHKTLKDYRMIWNEVNGSKVLNNVNLTAVRHEIDVKWLKEKLEFYKGRKIIVLTHHCPHYNLGDTSIKGRRLLVATSYYVNMYPVFSKYRIHAWAFGHTHFCITKRIGRTLFIANCSGSKKKAPSKGFRKELTVSIGECDQLNKVKEILGNYCEIDLKSMDDTYVVSKNKNVSEEISPE